MKHRTLQYSNLSALSSHLPDAFAKLFEAGALYEQSYGNILVIVSLFMTSNPNPKIEAQELCFPLSENAFLAPEDDLFKLINTEPGLMGKHCDSVKALQHTEHCVGNARLLK